MTEPSSGVPIPFRALAPDTLRGVVEEFVTRDGTDLNDSETKIEQVLALLHRGEVELWFDERTRTCQIRSL